MEEIDYSVLFRWFVGLSLDEEVWDLTVFSKNRHRLLEAEVAKQFLEQAVEQQRASGPSVNLATRIYDFPTVGIFRPAHRAGKGLFLRKK